MSTDWSILEPRIQLAGMVREHHDGALLSFGQLAMCDSIELAEGEHGPTLMVPANSGWEYVGIKREEIQRVLPAFVRLASQQPADVLRFAKRWGMLGLCEHMLPASHRTQTRLWIMEAHWSSSPGDSPWRSGADLHRRWEDESACALILAEPVVVWQRFAREARALLAIAERVHRGEPASPLDWLAIIGREPSWYPDVASDADWLGITVSRWLLLGDVRPWLDCQVEDWRIGKRQRSLGLSDKGSSTIQGPPRIVLHTETLFGIIARELALTIARVSSLSLCTGCGVPFTPKRSPPPGRRSWCSDCRESGASKKQAVRDYRARKRRASQEAP